MAKKIKKEEVAATPAPEVVAETVAEEVKASPVPEAPKEAPVAEVAVTGHFYILRRGEGFVVVNRSGQVVSRQLPEAKAKETAQRFEGLTR